MINESYSWKKELHKNYANIVKFSFNKNREDKDYVILEKSLIMGAYICRKLYESEKLPPLFLKNKEMIRSSKLFDGKLVDSFNSHKIDTNYDLEKSLQIEKDWEFILNQMIHSYVIFYVFNNNDELIGVLVNSSNVKDKEILFVPLQRIYKIFLSIACGDLISKKSEREILGYTPTGKPKLGRMIYKEGKYSYPKRFDINKIVENSILGTIYKKQGL
ncbi:hypothetical protein [uncultured Chryseobacterium sp.]|jgi:hypothetical protein|uniref:hypothetical protein n=1 Tax=uncultured Chryseobacterium sp. TaxID=259322 RepID=UPI0026091DF4|nr:hypothetical protein [uncultured Chryseobacterium sp.]